MMAKKKDQALASVHQVAQLVVQAPDSGPSHPASWWRGHARTLAVGYLRHALPPVGEPLLEGAADIPGPDRVWPKNAADFAARWNTEPQAYRDLFVSRLQTVNERANECMAWEHAKTIEKLRQRSQKPRLPFNLARVLNDAVAERERAAGNTSDVQESLAIVAGKSPAEVILMRAELLNQVGLSLIVLEQLDARMADATVA